MSVQQWSTQDFLLGLGEDQQKTKYCIYICQLAKWLLRNKGL